MEVPKYKTPVRNSDPNKPRKKHDRFNGLTEEQLSQLTLPDHLAPGLDIVFVSGSLYIHRLCCLCVWGGGLTAGMSVRVYVGVCGRAGIYLAYMLPYLICSMQC